MNLLFFAGSAALFVFMSTPASDWFWEHAPLLSFAQFPWRFVGRASLPVALLVGATMLPLTQYRAVRGGTDLPPGGWLLDLVPTGLVSILVLAAFPLTYAPSGYCPEMPYPGVEDVHRYEHATRLVGVDPEGAYFPVWVEQRPTASPLEAQYAGEGPVARFDERMLPAGADILAADYGPTKARILVRSPEPFRARYLSFYFPGWRAWVDGDPVQITPSDSEGLITFEVPAGEREVTVRFGETPLRRLVNAISALCLAAFLGYWFWPMTCRLAGRFLLCGGAEERGGRGAGEPAAPPFRFLTPWLLGMTAVLLLVLKLGVVDRIETPFRHAKLGDDGELPGVEHPLNQPYADGLTLIGFGQSATEMRGDGLLRVDLHWTVRHQPFHRYQAVIHLVGADGLRWSHSDSYRPTDYQDGPPSVLWTPGRHVLDSHEVEVLPGTPPGVYDIVLTVFDRESLVPLSVLDEGLQPIAPELTLGQVRLAGPRSPIQAEKLGIRERMDVGLGPLTLLGVRFDRDQAAPGDPVFVTTFWRADADPDEDLELHLELLAPDGSVAGTYDLPPAADWHPVSAWEPGDVWRGQSVLHLPADLDSGEYGWRLSVPPMEPVVELPTATRVDAPERSFVAPAVDAEVDASFGQVATLVGASFEPEPTGIGAGDSLTITLTWRARAETNVSYRVFVHLVDPEGRLAAQSDGVPGRWTRPTTGWVTGEYITDIHTLRVPVDVTPGDYALRAGLYGPGGERLTAATGQDFVALVSFAPELPE